MIVKSHESLEIWNELEMTDPTFTKEYRGKGNSKVLTDIDPTWRMKRLTSLFGPCGKGWGWTTGDRWTEVINGEPVCYVAVTLWWRDPEPNEDGEHEVYKVGPQIGGTVFGTQPDEAYKKSITDGFGKCCAALGLSADVYMGMFNDSKYVHEAEQSWGRRKSKAENERWKLTLEEIEANLSLVTDLAGVERIKQRVWESSPPQSTYPRLKELFTKAIANLHTEEQPQ